MGSTRTAQLILPLVSERDTPRLPEAVREEARRLLVQMLLRAAGAPAPGKEETQDEREDPSVSP